MTENRRFIVFIIIMSLLCIATLKWCSIADATTCTWQYNSVWTPSDTDCIPGQPQFLTAVGTPPGCTGTPDQVTVKVCTPGICTGGWLYGPWTPPDATCITGQTQVSSPIAGSGSIPSQCVGGVLPPSQTKVCTVKPCTGGWIYGPWVPGDDTCSPGQTQISTVIPNTGSTPSGCVGGFPSATYHSKICSAVVSNPGPGPVTPVPSSFTPIIWNNGSQSFSDSINPGETRYYTFTVPAGITTFSMNVSSISQNANLDMVLSSAWQGIDGALQAAVDYYNTNPSLTGTPYYNSHTWAKMSTDFDGEGIYMKQCASDSATCAASITGTYYVAVRNESTTAVANYYVYVKQ